MSPPSFRTWYLKDRMHRLVSEGTLTIGGYVNQACVQFITGDLDVEKDWDTYINKLETMGVENYIATYQSAYDTYMSNLQ